MRPTGIEKDNGFIGDGGSASIKPIGGDITRGRPINYIPII